ncbi:MAG: hypothetical protein ACMG57_02160 [Candidatus Dojkabacteria bacterium]
MAQILAAYDAIMNIGSRTYSEYLERKKLYIEATNLLYSCLLKLLEALNADADFIEDRKVELELTIRKLDGIETSGFDERLAKELITSLNLRPQIVPKRRIEAIDNLISKTRQGLVRALLRDKGIYY